LFIIFDLDDTLIDTSESITPFQLKKALVFALQKIGRSDECVAAYKCLMELNQGAPCGNSALKTFLEHYGVSGEIIDGATEILRSIPDPEIPILAMQNAQDVVQALSSHRLAIVTIGREELQQYKLKKAGFDPSLFSKIIVTAERNKKIHYAALLEEYNQAPQKTIVVGDRVMIDLQPAKELGCQTVRLLKGRGFQAFQKEEDHERIVKDPFGLTMPFCPEDSHSGSKGSFTPRACVVDHAIRHIDELIAIVERYEARSEGSI